MVICLGLNYLNFFLITGSRYVDVSIRVAEGILAENLVFECTLAFVSYCGSCSCPSLPLIFVRPDPAVQERNLDLLHLTLGVELFERLRTEITDLLKLDSGSWAESTVTHHCQGLFCCKNEADTKKKIWNAIVVTVLPSYSSFFNVGLSTRH